MDPYYNAQHKFSVNGSPAATDVKFNDGTWHTVLASGEAAGGKSVFAIDMTEPLRSSTRRRSPRRCCGSSPTPTWATASASRRSRSPTPAGRCSSATATTARPARRSCTRSTRRPARSRQDRPVRAAAGLLQPGLPNGLSTVTRSTRAARSPRRRTSSTPVTCRATCGDQGRRPQPGQLDRRGDLPGARRRAAIRSRSRRRRPCRLNPRVSRTSTAPWSRSRPAQPVGTPDLRQHADADDLRRVRLRDARRPSP